MKTLEQTIVNSINKNDIYILESIEYHNGNAKAGELYNDFLNNYCHCLEIVKYETKAFLKFQIICDKDKRLKFKYLQTRQIDQIDIKEKMIIVRTFNSVYTFIKSNIQFNDLLKLNPKKDVIELWMKGTGSYFGKGIYWNKKGELIYLVREVHISLLHDSVLVCDEQYKNIYCRYFLYRSFNEIEFYNTLYKYGNEIPPLLIHNISDVDLTVSIQGKDDKWIIKPRSEVYVGEWAK